MTQVGRDPVKGPGRMDFAVQTCGGFVPALLGRAPVPVPDHVRTTALSEAELPYEPTVRP